MHSSIHGSHVCHKCGWSFPNPHPSAKHRRAHKKVCGKIEGFKENAAHLSISDDEEDHDKGEEIMRNVKRQVSTRSEEEEFSDAVAEFVNSETSSARAQITVGSDVAEGDLNSSSSANVTKPPENHHSNQMKSPEALDNSGAKSENDMQSETSMSSKVTSLVTDMTIKSLAPELTKEENISPTSVSPVESNLPENPLTEESIKTNENLNSLVQINENTGTNGKGEGDENLSTAEATSGKIESKASEIDLDSLKMEGFTEGDSLDIPDVKNVNSVTLLADGIMGMEDVRASEQKMSQNEVPLGSSGPTEAEVIEHIGDFVDGARVKADSDNVNTCNEEKVNEKNTSIPKPFELPVEEPATLNVNDSEDPEPAKLEPSLTFDSAEATVETIVQNLECKEGHNGFLSNKSNGTGIISSSAVQALEDKVSQEGALNKSMVEHAYVEGEHDTSAVNDTREECLESTGSGTLPDTASRDLKSSNTETNQMIFSLEEQELQISQQNLSFEIQPQTITGVSAACDVVVSPADAVNSETNGVVTCEADAVHGDNSKTSDTDEISIGEAIAVADLSTDIPEDAVNNGAKNVVTCQDDAVHTEGKKSENSDVAEKCIGATAVEDLSTDREFVPEDDRFYELKPNLQGTITTPLDACTNSNEKEHLIESSNDKQDCHGEHFLDSSEEPVVEGSTDSSAPETLREETIVALDGSAVEPVQIERKSSIDTEVAQIQSGSENTELKESLPSAMDSGPNEPSSSNVEVRAKDFVKGDDTEEGDRPIKQQPEETSPIVPPEGSVDSISQTDSIEGQWGSVSDGTVPSSRYAADTPKSEDQVVDLKEIKGAHENQFASTTDIAKTPFVVSEEAGREDGQLSSFSEIQAVENQQQMQSPSLPAGASPSLSHVVLESQGKKKNEEEIIAKVVNWSSDKSRTPLRSLLVEANLESKQKTGSDQSHLNPATKKVENPSATDVEGLSVKQVPSTKAELPSIYDATKGNSGKEWNSPARLPNSREKRKVRYWVPLCCSSVN